MHSAICGEGFKCEEAASVSHTPHVKCQTSQVEVVGLVGGLVGGEHEAAVGGVDAAAIGGISGRGVAGTARACERGRCGRHACTVRNLLQLIPMPDAAKAQGTRLRLKAVCADREARADGVRGVLCSAWRP